LKIFFGLDFSVFIDVLMVFWGKPTLEREIFPIENMGSWGNLGNANRL